MLPQNMDIPVSFTVPSPLLTAQWRVRGPKTSPLVLSGTTDVLQNWAPIDLTQQTLPNTVLLTVPAALNQIQSMVWIDNSYDENVQAPAIFEGRVVDLMIGVAGGPPAMSSLDYTIGVDQQLVVMQNSFQLYPEAAARAAQIPNLVSWNTATSDVRMTALMEAFQRLARLNYEVYYDRDDVYFRNRASWGLPFINTIGRLYNYTETDFYTLDPDFINKICRAQVIEADDLIGGDPVRSERESGVMSVTNGQSSHTFRAGKPLKTSICVRAMQEMGGYLKFSVRTIRS